MGRRQTFLLLLVLCVFASFVSAQTASVEFLDEWGDATSRVLEQGKVLLRVIDPAADTTPGRDSVTVDLGSVVGQDEATAQLTESGGDTGVFEGEAVLTTDYALDNIYGVDADQLYTTWTYPGPTLDTATASYGAATDSVEAGPSVTHLVDGEGRGTETVTLGGPVRVQVRDAYADQSSGPDRVTATLATTGGDSEVVALTETGAHTRTFLGSLPTGTGAPVAGDGRIQSSAGETLSVNHVDLANGVTSSSDTALVAGASVSFIRPRDGRTTDLLLANSAIVVRAIDVSRNLDPTAVDSLGVSIAMVLGEDYEYFTLHETGPDTGVFEGAIRHLTNYPTSGSGYLESYEDLVPAHLDTVQVQYESYPYVSITEAPMTVSTTRLVDEDGADSESVVLGSGLRVEVETAADYSSPFLDVRDVEVRSLATGDLETLRLAETDGRSYLFTGAIPVVPGTAAAGDGSLQAQPGETVEVVHDSYGIASSDQAVVARSAVRFVDEAGLPVPALVEQSAARVRILDVLSAGQAPPSATIRSRITQDIEPLGLAELSAGLFEGSIPMRLWDWSSGILGTGREYVATREPDTITASAGQASASLLMMPAILEVVDGQGEPRATAAAGDTLTIRAIAPRADTASVPETIFAVATSDLGGDWQYVYLLETGDSTGIFEGTVETVRAGTAGTAPIEVEPADRIEVVYDASDYPNDPNGRVTAAVAIVPTAVQLLDGEGEAAASYVFGDDIHVRVAEPAANADPAMAEDLTVTVSSHRYGDTRSDVETVTLAETGPDTGVFTGALPTGVLLNYLANPVPGDGLLQFGDFVPEPDNHSKVTATRNGASASAQIRGSELWLTDDQGQDADSFEVGSTIQVWMRWPTGNTTPGIETISVKAQVNGVGDTVYLTLAETGGDSGLFTATLPTGPPPNSNVDGILQGGGGDLIFVERSFYHLYSFDTAVFTGEGEGEPPNQEPDAVDDSASTNEDLSVYIEVAANDTDPDGDTIEVFHVWQPANGSVNLLPDGTVSYSPFEGFSGTDSFMYVIRDGPEGSPYLTDIATVTITVNPVNDPPHAADDFVTTNEDTPKTVAVKANDLDPDGDTTLTVTALTQPSKGTAVLNADQTITYAPDLDANGNDSFTYSLSDGNGGTDTGTVSVNVTPVNDPPSAVADSATVAEEGTVTIPVAANDTDPDNTALTLTAVTQGAHGTVTILAGNQVSYQPAANYSGPDTFTYTIRDPGFLTSVGTVSVTVTPVNDAPSAAPDSGATREGVAVIIPVLANDTDVEGSALSVTAVGSPGVLLPDGTVSYTPGANFTGTATFAYTVSDGLGGTASGQVTVTVGEALERVAILATNSVALRSGSDVLSGDVIVNQAGAGPFLNGAELSIAGSVTTPANWDVEADSLTVAAGSVVGGDVSYNQLTNGGTINGLQRSPLALPVWAALPAFLTATPGTTTINVATNGTRTLAPGSYLDLVVGRKGTVTFTGGTYHFRSITVDREAKLLFSAASQVRVQQKLSTKNLTTVGPAAGASIDASSILFYVAGINGTTGALAATPKAVEIGTNNTVAINLYAPNGTLWLQDGTLATGAFLGKDVDLGANAQVTLDSAWQ